MNKILRYGTAAAVLLLGAWLTSPTDADHAALAASAPRAVSPAPVALDGQGQPATPTAASLRDCPLVALIATRPGADTSALFFVHPSDRAVGNPELTFSHRPEGSVRGQILPGTTTVVANAATTAGRDTTFNGGLYRLEPAAGTTLLCDGLTHASRPLVTADRRVFVVRGLAGPPPDYPGQMRVDEFRIDEVDPTSGQLHAVHDYDGYWAHLAGWLGGELLIYRVGPGHADIIAVNPDTGTLRPLVPKLPPFARDFSTDAARGVLVFRGRHPTDSRLWTVEQVDEATGARHRHHEGPTFATAPHVWPGGAIAFNPQHRGLRLLGSPDPIGAPLGTGVDLVRAISPTERFVALLHTRPSRLATPFVLDRLAGTTGTLPMPAGSRAAIAGFVDAALAQGGAP